MIHTNFNNQLSATSAMQRFIITTSDKLKQNADYKKVAQIISKLIESGVTFAAKGYCISMSDIVYTLLKQNGIPCKILECHLAITSKVSNEVFCVGFDGLKETPDRADTHVIVITETEIPMIIDVSIAHLLPNNIQGVIDEVCYGQEDIFANIHNDLVALTYQKKKESSIPMLHQRSIVDRIQTDINIFKSLKMLKYIVIVALTISLINAGRGFYDFYKVYGDHDINWGPAGIDRIIEKIDALTKKLDK